MCVYGQKDKETENKNPLIPGSECFSPPKVTSYLNEDILLSGKLIISW
jgi:hypothetical protein